MKIDNRIWILITAILSIGLVAGGWFVGVDPLLQSASAANSQKDTIEAQSLVTKAKVASLAAANDNLPELTDQLDGLQASVPPGIDAADFLAQINELGVRSGVVVTNLTLDSPTVYTPPAAPEAAAPAAEEGSSSDSGDTASADAPAAAPSTPTAPLPVTNPLITSANFIVVPITIEVSGQQANVMSFLKALQTGERLVLVTGISGGTTDAADGESASSFDLTINGNMYVLRNAGAEAEVDALATAEAAAGTDG